MSALGGLPAELRAADSAELPCTASADGKSVTVAMPADMAMGKYRLSVKNANAERFGEFTYDAHCKALVDERGAMCLVGFGYRVSKIEYK